MKRFVRSVPAILVASAATLALIALVGCGLVVNAAGNLYYADANRGYQSNTHPSVLLEIFSSSATGNMAPTASITSSAYTYPDLFGYPLIQGFFPSQLAIH